MYWHKPSRHFWALAEVGSTYINAACIHPFKLLSHIIIYHILNHSQPLICLLESVTSAFCSPFCHDSWDKSQSGKQPRCDRCFVRRAVFKSLIITWSSLWSFCNTTGTSVHSFVGQLHSFYSKIYIYSSRIVSFGRLAGLWMVTSDCLLFYFIFYKWSSCTARLVLGLFSWWLNRTTKMDKSLVHLLFHQASKSPMVCMFAQSLNYLG